MKAPARSQKDSRRMLNSRKVKSPFCTPAFPSVKFVDNPGTRGNGLRSMRSILGPRASNAKPDPFQKLGLSSKGSDLPTSGWPAPSSPNTPDRRINTDHKWTTCSYSSSKCSVACASPSPDYSSSWLMLRPHRSFLPHPQPDNSLENNEQTCGRLPEVGSICTFRYSPIPGLSCLQHECDFFQQSISHAVFFSECPGSRRRVLGTSQTSWRSLNTSQEIHRELIPSIFDT